MSENLKNGSLVVINNAFQPEFAEHVWESYNAYNESDWTIFNFDPAKIRPWYHPGSDFHYHEINAARKTKETREAAIAYNVFNHNDTKKFISNLVGRDVEGNFDKAAPSLYRPGDYANFHSDLSGSRAVTFLWQLSKDWDPSWGGAFYWTAAKNIRDAYRHAKFNTLMLFQVSAISQHGVTPVTPKAQGRRLTYAGWFNDKYGSRSMDEPLEELYRTREARKQLSNADAFWLADLSVNDPKRKQHIEHIQEAIRNEIISPQFDDPVLVIEKRGSNIGNDHDSPRIKGEGFKIKPGSSIVDYVSPTILEDTEMLDTIRSKLRKGYLVAIKDAFIPEFAEYVWQDVSPDDFGWKAVLLESKTVLGYTKRNSIAADKTAKVLNETLAVFNHPETKRFIGNLSGRDCTGQVKANIERYGPGDYSGPDNQWREDHTMTFFWSLTKGWEAGMGGSLYWMAARNALMAYQDMSFNTLFLLNVGALTSNHAVTVVQPYSGGNVLLFGGQFTATMQTISVEDPIEEWYGTKEDRARLSQVQAEKIVYDLNPEALNDLDRKRMLIEIQAAVRNEVLVPDIEDNVYMWNS